MIVTPTRILVATDLLPHSDRALDRAVFLATQIGAALEVVHVIEAQPPQGSMDVLEQEAAAAIERHVGSRFQGSLAIDIRFGEAPEEIMDSAAACDAGMILLGTHEPAGADLFRHPTIARVLRESGRPVLLVRERPHAPYAKIMVAVDQSDCSRRALALAINCFRNAEFTAVHAYDVPFAGFVAGTEANRAALDEHTRRTAEIIAAGVANFVAQADERPLSVTPLVCRGLVREVVEAEVKRLRPDLLVIGTRSRKGVMRALLGSVAEDLLRNPPCDVLAVC